jgi:glutamate dehydrogenase/leucine dehydrogenase
MTYKAAAASLPLGGGKAVIIGDPTLVKTEALLEAYGRAVDQLGGTYVTAEDVGTTVEDLVVVATQTEHVMGLPVSDGGSGDPSPATARGVLAAMRATADHLWGTTDLGERRVAIQGVGKVGIALLALLEQEGCKVSVADVDEERAEAAALRYGAQLVHADEILSQQCDILAPCALGGVLNERTIPALRCAAIVGSANNQLRGTGAAERIADAGIAYAPDFVANAGGIINIVEELKPEGYSWDRARDEVERIFDTTSHILAAAKQQGVTPRTAAVSFAEERLNAQGVG